jgi:mono/diheme cytochrome c family protein
MRSRPAILAGIVLLCTARATLALAETPAGEAAPREITAEEREFFEESVRPVLVAKCYSCHSAEAKTLRGELHLDSRAGVAAGGALGPIVDGVDPESSTLIQAVRWSDPYLQMPPSEKLSDQQIAALEQWVRMGVPDPRDETAATATAKKIDIEAGRTWWAFQPVAPIEPPALPDDAWSKNKIDRFVLPKLRDGKLEPSPQAERDVLLRRSYLDLIGLRPTFDEVQAFIRDESPDAYERVIDKLLASPQYGERWGRYWLDVVRYGEDNFTGEATTPPYPFAWRYRDWVIDAINRDVPYDRFVKLQLAADLMPGTPREEMVALGFLGAAPGYHKDGRLSKEVVETLYCDDWDERVDTVTRGFLGLTVACARCHDHKFDPIPTSDYYALAGVFASTVQSPRPLKEIDPEAELRFMVDTQRIFYRSYVANLLRDDPGSKPEEAREKVKRYTAEMEQFRDENAALRDTHPEMFALLTRLAKRPNPYPDEPQPENPEAEAPRERRGRRGGSTDPLFHAVYDAGFHIDGSDPDFTMFDIRPGEPRELNILPGGVVAKPGAVAPRGFLSVLSVGDAKFQEGSGRRELAERIFTDAAPLSARVIVNRVWAWHFGKPLVATPSDFGMQGEKPTHPELLDDLAARFVEHGYSLKWLHREIMTSATYQQASHPREEAVRVDPSNQLVWRMNPRRLDIEAYRDCLLQASGNLDDRMGGPSEELDRDRNSRRTVYARASRGRTSALLQLYDFPPASIHSPQRDSTTSPLQQLFMMNSGFVQNQAETLARKAGTAPDIDGQVRELYRRIVGRDPKTRELEIAREYLGASTLEQYAQALLATNEVIFWP